jgi:hypothetical protein
MAEMFHDSGFEAPPMMYGAYTPHDTQTFAAQITGGPPISRGISLSAAVDVVLVRHDDVVVTIPAGHWAPGIIHPCRAKQIKATGTGVATFVIYW